MITNDKVTEIFCIADDFCKEFEKEIAKNSLKAPDGKKHRHRKCLLSDSEIITILICFHFNDCRNFKHYYLLISQVWRNEFPGMLSYNRFVE